MSAAYTTYDAEKHKMEAKDQEIKVDGVSDLGVQVTNSTVAGETFEEQKFNVLSLVGIGYSVTNTAMAILASLASGIGSGGPVLYIWGQIGILIVALAIATTLAEFSSAMPNAGGQFFWVSKLAPRKYAGGLSYTVGILAWASSVCIVASGTLLTPQMAIGMYILRRPDFIYKPWMGFLGFQAMNIFVFFFNTVERFLPVFSRASMAWSATSIFVIFIAILARSSSHQSAEFVFTNFTNLSGWNSSVIAALTGIIGINWGYSCLDACTHLAEEIPNPERNVPKALFATVIVGFLTSVPITLAMLFCITDITEVITTPTMVPSLALFYQVFQFSSAAAIGLQCLIFVAFIGSIFGAHTWQARLCWSFARHRGLPFHRHLGSIAPHPFSTPLWAHAFSCACVAVLGCVYLGSTTAFNAFVGAGLLFQYVTYTICVLCLFYHGRKNFAHGPFWLPKLGPAANLITVIWTLYSLIIYSFPPYMPVTPETMNYVSVVVVAITLFATIYYWIYGRKQFRYD